MKTYPNVPVLDECCKYLVCSVSVVEVEVIVTAAVMVVVTRGWSA